jgi:hypothetical protein
MEPGPQQYSTRPSIMAGLSQWIVFGGGNIAGQLKFGRFVAEYSHGQALELDRVPALGLTSAERDAGVGVLMPWTTGGGFGYQITPEFHVLLEVKAHRYEVRGVDRNQVARYSTFSIGPGIFYDIYLYKGLFVQPNVRYWPTVLSTFNARDAVFSTSVGTPYRHERHDLDLFFNVNLGWTIAGT